jgi:hypothetical protein
MSSLRWVSGGARKVVLAEARKASQSVAEKRTAALGSKVVPAWPP